jgi:hypothetical protein
MFGSATFSIGFTPPTDLYLGGLLTDLYQGPTDSLHVKEALLTNRPLSESTFNCIRNPASKSVSEAHCQLVSETLLTDLNQDAHCQLVLEILLTDLYQSPTVSLYPGKDLYLRPTVNFYQ